jgi:Ca2+-binding RTX toxin-like protein
MFRLNRKAFAAIGITAATVASTAFLGSPAQAATAGFAKVVGSSTVQFQALQGKANNLVITISGKTVTLDDTVAIKPGKGCKKVDKTKVKCKTSGVTKLIKAALGDKNDAVNNKTKVALLANGGPGNDKLTGGSGADELQGGVGNDTTWGAAGNDKLFGNAGNDTIYAGAGNDFADGGAGNDLVHGNAGNDTLFGNAGNDRVFAGAGVDDVDAGAGSDTVYGEAGDDYLLGGAGNDVLSGGNGLDIIEGAAGDDKVIGGNQDDLIDGGPGSDRISAGAGDDVVLGNTGNDYLYGEAGIDAIVGEAGNDVISGAASDDLLISESIDESLKPIGSATATDRVDGGAHAAGDICLVLAGATTAGCEISEFPVEDLSVSSVGSAQKNPALESVTARLLEVLAK